MAKKEQKNPAKRTKKRPPRAPSKVKKQPNKIFFLHKQGNVVKVVFGVLVFLASVTMIFDWFGDGGWMGEKLNNWFTSLLGVGFAAVPVVVIFNLARKAVNRAKQPLSFIHFVHGIIWIITAFSFLGLAERAEISRGGGTVGAITDSLITGILGNVLGIIAMFSLVLFGGIAIAGLPVRNLARRVFTKTTIAIASIIKKSQQNTLLANTFNKQKEDPLKQPTKPESLEKVPVEQKILPAPQREEAKQVNQKEEPPEEKSIISEPLQNLPSKYIKPSLKLLSQKDGSNENEDTDRKVRIVEQTLQNFGIIAKISDIAVGSSVTRLAFKPTPGMKLSKIKNLQNELALALAAKTLRIEAPIPGRSLVGIEVPNDSVAAVRLGTMIANKQFQNNPKPITIALGRDIAGKAHYSDLAKMPHMLIAGATGSGKSIAAQGLIISLLYRNGPDMLRMLMVDPKRVELTLYNGIPHLLTPVIKDAKRAILALNWAVKEMERRYNVLEKAQVRDIQSYHSTIVNPAHKDIKANQQLSFEEKKSLPEKMPYIVIIIDELADIMQVYPRELESSIVRLAQMSRAVGIHLVLSTQRPSVNVITGLIKANIPTRLALRVASQIDSRTILDKAGAETLLGRGDMLFKSGDMANPVRLQSAFVEEDEVKRVVKEIIEKNKTFAPDEIELSAENDKNVMAHSKISSDDTAGDELFEDAKDLVVRSGRASTSFIQRKMRVGYSRAARIIDLLEDAGIVGPANGSKPRIILTGPSTDPRLTTNQDDTHEETTTQPQELL